MVAGTRGRWQTKRKYRGNRAAYLEALEQRVLLTTWQPTVLPMGIGMGGTCYNAIMNPLNPNEFYLETDMGEVWHTWDDGLHWTTLNMQTQLRSNAQTDGVQFTSNTNIQYAISGSNTPMVTNDDGSTWTQLTGWAAIKAQDGGSASHLIVDPNSSNRLVMIEQKAVGSDYDWWAYYSTNGGASFTLINSDTTATQTDEPWVAGSFWDGNNIYFATFKGLYTTTNGGTSWNFTSSTALSKPNDANGFTVNSGQTYSKIVSFTGSRSGSTTRLWAIAWNGSVATVSATANGFSTYAGLYTSTDGGVTWTETEGGIFGQQGSGKIITPRFVGAVDNDINSLWVGGGDNSAATSMVVYKSTNAGTSFSRMLQTGYDTTAFPGETPNQNVYTRTWGVGGDFNWGYLGTCITMSVDRLNGNIVNITGMGTLFGTIDGGSNWYDLEGGGPNQLPNSAWNPEGKSITKGTAYGSSQANETSAWDVTPINPTTLFIDDTDVAGQYTTNNGTSFSYLQTPGVGIPNTFYQSTYVPSTNTLYAVTSDKHDIFTNNIDDGEIEQFGSNYIVKSTNNGATWTVLHTFPVAAPARTLAVDPNNPNIAYVGTDNHNFGTGGIWKTTDLQDGTASVWVYLGNGTGASVTATLTNTITGAAITAGGSGYAASFAVTFTGGGGSGATGTATATSGAITSITITNAGSGYTSAPTINFSAGGGAGAAGVGTFSVSGFTNLVGGSGYIGSLVGVLFNGGLATGGTTAAAHSTTTSGAFNLPTLDNAGSGYTSAPTVTLVTGNQPHRDINNDGTQDFASMYPEQITILNDGTIVVAAAVRLGFSGYLSPNSLSYTSGVWVSTDGGTTWSDRSSVTGDGTDIYNNGHDMYYTQGNLLTTEAFAVTVDPNDPTQNTWFATTYYFGTQPYGTIYKSTDRGQHWTAWEQWPSGGTGNVVGQAEDLWIQPGGKMMLATTKNGLYYSPDYTAATPQFYPVSSFPFNGNPSFKIVSDPFNTNRVYVTTFGDGVWTIDVSQIGTAGIVNNVAAKTMSPTEVQLSWTLMAPFGNSYTIQSSTDDVNWTNAATVPNAMETSYMVTGLIAGTKYYFRVLSVDSAGNSAPSKIVTAYTDSSAGLIASEEVTQATGNLNGTGSGTGWSSTWTAGTGDTVVAGNINNSNPPDNTGNYISIASTGVDASRTLTNTIGTPGSVVWIGFEITTATQAAVLFGDSTNGFGLGSQTYSNYPSFITINNSTVTEYRVSSTSGNHYLVGRLEFRTDGTVAVSVYIDPTPGLIYPGNPVSTWTPAWSGVFTNTMLPTGTNKITLRKPSSGTAKYDEIRIGGSYLDVAPKTGVAIPTAPSGMTATAASNNQVNISWTNNASNQQGFTIEEFNGSSWSTIERLYNTSASASVVSYAVTNLSANTAYQFRVSAFDSAGSSGTALSNSVTTLVNSPTPVTNLGVTVSNGTFNLTWSNVPNNSGYVLQYANGSVMQLPYNNGELGWTNASPIAANATAATVSGLTPNALYYFRIYAVNANGQSTNSNVVSATAFAAPTNVNASGIADTQALVTWTNNFTGTTGFNVQYSTDGTNWLTAGAALGTDTQYTVTGLSADKLYYFRVQAFAPGSTGPWSTAATARTLATLTGEIAYDGFNEALGGGNNWNGQTSGIGFTNGWSVSDTTNTGVNSGSLTYSAGGNTLLSTGNDVWLYQSSSATRGVNYTFGQDDTSLWVGFVIQQHATGGTASLYSGVAIGSDANNHIDLGSWNGSIDADAMINGNRYYMQAGTGTVVDNAVDFLVYRIDFGHSTGTPVPDKIRVWLNPTPGVVPSDASANATLTLPAGVYFTFTDSNIRIYDSSYYNHTTFDELRLGTTYGAVAPVALPNAPSGLNATGGTGSVALNWTDNSTNETGFHVERSTDGVNFTVVQTVGAGVSTWTDTALASGTYYYRVSSYDSSGDSLYTNTANATATGSGDTTPPTVTGVYVDSTQWTASYLNLIASTGHGSATLGYLMPTGSAQLNALPWSDINQVSIQFSEPVNVTQAELALTGTNVASYGFSGFSVSGNVATWTVNQLVPRDTLMLNLSSAVTDLAGNQLDGEWTDGVSTVSGNGTAGGNFQYHLKVLPGDANQSGTVDLTDLTMLSSNWQQTVTTWTQAMTDFNGSGTIDLTDLTVMSGNWQQSAPALAVGGGSLQAVGGGSVQAAMAPATTTSTTSTTSTSAGTVAPMTVSGGDVLTVTPLSTLKGPSWKAKGRR